MAFTITREDESLPQTPLIIAIYGDPGIGKTSFTFTSNDPLLMDFDKGVQRCIGRKTTVNFQSWKDVEEFVYQGHLDEISPSTLIVDTGGTMLDDFIGDHVMKNDSSNKKKSGTISLQGYGAMKDVFRNFTMIELRKRNIDLVIICHATESEDDGRRTLRPKMTGGSKDILIAKADLLGYMSIENDQRVLNFNPTSRHIGKNCAEFPPIIIKDYHKDESYKTQFAEIIQSAKDHINKQSEAQKEALIFINDFKSKVELCNNSEELELLEDLTENLSKTYKVQTDKLLLDKHLSIWEEENLVNAKTEDDFNLLLKKVKDVSLRRQKDVKYLIWDHAKKENLIYDKKSSSFKLENTETSKPPLIKESESETNKSDENVTESIEDKSITEKRKIELPSQREKTV